MGYITQFQTSPHPSQGGVRMVWGVAALSSSGTVNIPVPISTLLYADAKVWNAGGTAGCTCDTAMGTTGYFPVGTTGSLNWTGNLNSGTISYEVRGY